MSCIATRALRIAAVTLLLAASAHDVLAQPQVSTLRIRLNADMRSTDPGVNRDANTDAVVLHMVEGLVAYRENLSVGPLLAESINTSVDGRTYTFTLRRGIRFHNGEPLTSADVVFAWNRYMTPKNNWRCLSEFDGRGSSKVVAVEAPDPTTVVFTLERPSVLFLTMLARTDCGETGIYHRSSVDADGRWRQPVGTGPFMWGTWKRGTYIELLRYGGYQALPGKPDGHTGGKAAAIAKVRFVVIPDASAAKAALQSGGVDILIDIESDDLPEFKGRKDIYLTSTAMMSLAAMLIQTRDPLLKDVRMRRALALSLDLAQLVEAVTSGMSKASRSVVPVPSSYYTAAQAQVPERDLALARRLLAEAGYKGESIKVLTTKRYPRLFDIAVIAQAMALQAGIRLEIEVLDWATLVDRYAKGDYQVMAFSFSSRLDPSLSYEMIMGPKDSQPRKVWDDVDAIELLAKSMATGDRAQRQALFDRLDEQLRQDVPAIFMYSGQQIGAARAYVSGYTSWSLGQARAWGVSMRAP